VVDGEHEGRTAEFHRIDPEHQVMHDGIAHQRGLENVLMRDAGLTRHVRRKSGECLAHRRRHQGGTAGIHHRIRNPAHQILAESDLRIHDPCRGNHLAAAQIAQVRRNGRGADIDGKSIDQFVQPGPHTDDLLARVYGHRDLPGPGAQRGLQGLQHRQIAGEILEAPFLFQRLEQPAQIAGRIVHVRLLDLNIVQTHHGVEFDRA
jgi:hypothetical protein